MYYGKGEFELLPNQTIRILQIIYANHYTLNI